MNTKLTIIVDNTSTGLFKGEWGLSVLVEYNDKKILVDAGASDLFLKNIQGLGIEVKDIDYGVLSHAHYEYGLIGGFHLYNKSDEEIHLVGKKDQRYRDRLCLYRALY